MCTLIVLDRVVPGFPVVVASNRDEFYSRAAAAPTRVAPREAGRPAFVAPQDLEAGGTWMGVNAAGVFVGLTNRATEERDARRRSRGLLVMDALGEQSAARVAARASGSGAGAYNPFHLLCADGREAFLTRLTEAGLDTRPLDPGIHVVGNRDLDDPVSRKLEHVRGAVAALDPEQPLGTLLGALARILRRHGQGESPLEDVCVHTPAYGTRSSALLALGPERRVLRWADGPPCESKYRSLSRLLDGFPQAPFPRATREQI